MADENIGNLSVGVTADLSDADQQLQDFVQQCIDAGQSLSQAMASWDELAGAADTLGGSAADAGAALESAGASGEDGAAGVSAFGDAAQEAEGESEGLSTALEGLGNDFRALAEAFAITEGLKEFGEEALNVFGEVQQATIALTGLTGSASLAGVEIESLKEIANTDALGFPALEQAAQRMLAFGISAGEVDGVLQVAANAAAATGFSFDQVTNAMDRMAISGMAATRQLTTLGITSGEMAQALGLAADATQQQITAAFKALGDQTDRIELLMTVMGQVPDVVEAMAGSILGQWQILKNNTEFLLEDIGADLAPIATAFLSFVNSQVIPFLHELVDGFNALPTPVKDVSLALGVMGALVPPLILGLGAVGIALSGLGEVSEILTAIMEKVGLAAGEEAAGHTAAAAATAAHGAAAAGATPEIAALAGAEGEAAIGGETATTALGAAGLTGVLGVLTIAAAVAIETFGAWKLAQLGQDADSAEVGIGNLVGGLKELGGDILSEAIKGTKNFSAALADELGISETLKPEIDLLTNTYGELKTGAETLTDSVNNNITSWTGLKDGLVAVLVPGGETFELFKNLQQQFAYTSTALGSIGWAASAAGLQSYNDKLIETIANNQGFGSSLNYLLQQQAAAKQALQDQKTAADAAAAAAKALSDQWKAADTIGAAAAVTFAKLPVSFDQFTAAVDDGGATAKSMISSINTEISKLEVTAAGMSGAPKANLLDWVDALNLAKEDIQNWQAEVDHGTVSVKEQTTALQEGIAQLLLHTQGTNSNSMAAQLEAESQAKAVTQMLLHTGAIGKDGQALVDLVTDLQAHQNATNADLPKVIGHTDALTGNAKAAAQGGIDLMSRLQALLGNNTADATGITVLGGHTAALTANAAGAKGSAEGLAQWLTNAIKQAQAAADATPKTDAFNASLNNTAAAGDKFAAAAPGIAGGLQIINNEATDGAAAYDHFANVADTSVASIGTTTANWGHDMSSVIDGVGENLNGLAADGLPALHNALDLTLIPVPPQLQTIGTGIQILTGHVNDLTTAQQKNKQATQDVQTVWTSLIPTFQFSAGELSDVNGLIDQQTASINALIPTINTWTGALWGADQVVNDLAKAMGDLNAATGKSSIGTSGGGVGFNTPGATDAGLNQFGGIIWHIQDAVNTVAGALSGSSSTSLTNTVANVTNALTGTGGGTGSLFDAITGITTAINPLTGDMTGAGAILQDLTVAAQTTADTLTTAASAIASSTTAVTGSFADLAATVAAAGPGAAPAPTGSGLSLLTAAAAASTAPAAAPTGGGFTNLSGAGTAAPTGTSTASAPVTSTPGGGYSAGTQPYITFVNGVPTLVPGSSATPPSYSAPTTPTAIPISNPSASGGASANQASIYAPITITGVSNAQQMANTIATHLKTVMANQSVN